MQAQFHQVGRLFRNAYAQTHLPSEDHIREAEQPEAVDMAGGNRVLAQGAHVRAERSDANMAFRSRPKPIVANGKSLCDETLRLANGLQVEHERSNVLPTTYGRRSNHTPAENLASNLLLDINMHVEECVQHEMERLPGAVTKLKQVVQLVHRMLDSHALPTDWEQMSAQGLLDARLHHLKNELCGAFSQQHLDQFFSLRNGNDAAVERFKSLALSPLNGHQQLQIKLLKMLFSQLPYFGGSVEYALKRHDSLEFWIYHLSTITRDPARAMLDNGDPHSLLKPLRDYVTPAASLMPRNNQRNLGTGVAEIEWQALPKAIRRELERELKKNLDPDNRKISTARSRENRSAYRQILERVDPGAIGTLWEADGTEIEDVWDRLSEDEKKVVYGNIAAIPWSDAHLGELGGSFELDFDTARARAGTANYLKQHPEMHGLTGLQNVAGVHGNVLEKPDIAGAKYIADLRRKQDELPAENRLNETQLQQKRLEFVEKQYGWFKSAYENHKPIVGGMSGHTLAYLNLYQSALDSAGGPAAAAGRPSMEYLRALMLAALTGNKRHHSYDEVMAASVGISNGADPLDYTDRASYQDLLRSDDGDISAAARRAFEHAAHGYAMCTSGTVLATLCDETRLGDAEKAAFRSDLEVEINRYHELLIGGENLPAANGNDAITVDQVQASIAALITRRLPNLAAMGNG